jgi:pyruvate/2-oxoglutarate dehydrogenase complex dihydrolipoamide dehydrogenase (E3) component
MNESLDVDICVIGGGSAGLSVAAGASQMGAAVVLVEKGRMGGDCLNFGCVPSKALLAAAKARHAIAGASRFGIDASTPAVDMEKIHRHVHGVIAGIAPHDSVERFEGLGVRVIEATATFTGPRSVRAGNVEVRARRFVIATGSSPQVPPIAGLDRVPYFTNETIFDTKILPTHLAIVGGGPIGLEMAQSFRRLGARVSVVEMQRILSKDDPELTAVIARKLRAEGIDLLEGTAVESVAPAADDSGDIRLALKTGDSRRDLEASHLLVATGRKVNVDGLDLEAAGVRYSATGIEIDQRLRTSNKRIFAIGDVAGGLQFTHVAGYHAGIVLRNVLFRLPAKAKHDGIPWVTYTDPELAHVGLSEAAARASGEQINILRWPFAENDRARAERATEGFAKIVTTRRGRILGASIAGHNAGDLILPWVLALENGLKISQLAGTVAPYPTRSEISKRVAGSYFVPKLFSERTRSIVRLLARLG